MKKETAKNAKFLRKDPRYASLRGSRKEKTLRPLRLLCALCG